MDISTARTFLAAAASGSFAAAAQRVHASAPTVTERIKQLEHLLGVRLFERDKRGCRLTLAGRRLVEPAEALVRAWEDGCARVVLPTRFERVLRIGGQHALWPPLLIPWLQRVRAMFPELAIQAAAAAPAHLNRALEDNELDMAFLYDPAHRDGIRSEEVALDRLVLVTAAPGIPWQENYVRVQWGERAASELAARLGDVPAPGLELDLGVLSLEYIVETSASGFVPERLAQSYLRAGKLHAVHSAPTVGFSPFVCWRGTYYPDLVRELISLAKSGMQP